ncbi:hypothetical protein Pelo_10587 [Pelomyxa schiedti]|nr:hypothetical protein Pelo_10587 [Pelomyxa schiedti]
MADNKEDPKATSVTQEHNQIQGGGATDSGGNGGAGEENKASPATANGSPPPLENVPKKKMPPPCLSLNPHLALRSYGRGRFSLAPSATTAALPKTAPAPNPISTPTKTVVPTQTPKKSCMPADRKNISTPAVTPPAALARHSIKLTPALLARLSTSHDFDPSSLFASDANLDLSLDGTIDFEASLSKYGLDLTDNDDDPISWQQRLKEAQSEFHKVCSRLSLPAGVVPTLEQIQEGYDYEDDEDTTTSTEARCSMVEFNESLGSSRFSFLLDEDQLAQIIEEQKQETKQEQTGPPPVDLESPGDLQQEQKPIISISAGEGNQCANAMQVDCTSPAKEVVNDCVQCPESMPIQSELPKSPNNKVEEPPKDMANESKLLDTVQNQGKQEEPPKQEPPESIKTEAQEQITNTSSPPLSDKLCNEEPIEKEMQQPSDSDNTVPPVAMDNVNQETIPTNIDQAVVHSQSLTGASQTALSAVEGDALEAEKPCMTIQATPNEKRKPRRLVYAQTAKRPKVDPKQKQERRRTIFFSSATQSNQTPSSKKDCILIDTIEKEPEPIVYPTSTSDTHPEGIPLTNQESSTNIATCISPDPSSVTSDHQMCVSPERAVMKNADEGYSFKAFLYEDYLAIAMDTLSILGNSHIWKPVFRPITHFTPTSSLQVQFYYNDTHCLSLDVKPCSGSLDILDARFKSLPVPIFQNSTCKHKYEFESSLVSTINPDQYIQHGADLTPGLQALSRKLAFVSSILDFVSQLKSRHSTKAFSRKKSSASPSPTIDIAFSHISVSTSNRVSLCLELNASSDCVVSTHLCHVWWGRLSGSNLMQSLPLLETLPPDDAGAFSKWVLSSCEVLARQVENSTP